MDFTPYEGDRYLDIEQIEGFCAELARALPDWVQLQTIGTSVQGRPIQLLTIGDQSGDPSSRPGFWIDAGTHCAEWTAVMAAVYTASRWATALQAGEAELVAWFRAHTVYLLPCISPDGYQAMIDGAPFIRSTLRPPRDGRPRVGLDPCDIDGDGQVRWMRWKSPAGTWVFDSDNPARMRHRTLDDPADQAWVVCSEGRMVEWDGVEWVAARREHGIDLNRNFPSHWGPFEMFGMDSGAYPLSEPESRAVVDAFAARPRIAAGLTHHTYTGCILTQPYRDPSPLSDADIFLMQDLARQSVLGTGYTVKKVYPEFAYDLKKPIVGVWADTMSTVFGVPGYTLELWNPYGYAGIEVDNPAEFFRRPDLDKIAVMMDRFAEDPSAVRPWRRFEHPELGEVELGGLDYMRTVRNPPLAELPAECERGFTVADRMRRALPRVEATAQLTQTDGITVLQVVFENLGFLSTSALDLARSQGNAPPLVARLVSPTPPIEGPPTQQLGWLDGWGAQQSTSARHPLYAGLPLTEGVRTAARWVLRGAGPVEVHWDAGRAGRGVLRVDI